MGYSDEAQAFLVRNSWGIGWKDAGYFFMRYGYLTDPNLSSAFWTIRLSEPPAPSTSATITGTPKAGE